MSNTRTVTRLYLGLAIGLGCLAPFGCSSGSRSKKSSSAAGVNTQTNPGGVNSNTNPGTTQGATIAAAAVAQVASQSEQKIGSTAPVVGLVFSLDPSTIDIVLKQVEVANSGTVDESTLGDASLIDDANGNGEADPGEAILATAAAPTVDDAPYVFQPTPAVPLLVGTPRSLLITVDTSALTQKEALGKVGQTLKLSIAAATSIVADGTGSTPAPATANGPFPLEAETVLEFHDHALISEICTGPGSAATSAEFIEIINPTGKPFDLSTVYLTDYTDLPTNGRFYWKLPTGVDFGPAFSDPSYDFLVRFPAGAVLAPGQIITVAIDAEGFKAAHGIDPTYCMRNMGSTTATQMLAWDGVAGGVNFVQQAVHNNAGLTGPSGGVFGRGEHVALFSWDGTSDLIVDIDQVNYGDGSATNTSIDKSPNQQATNPNAPDVTVDSAFDNDTTASTYNVEADELFHFNHRAPLGASVERVDFTEGQEVKTGGNGITGNDEGSEDFGDGQGGNGTFQPGAAATPGTLP